MRDPSKYLLLKHKNPRVYPIGTHTWALGSDNALCAMKKEELVELSLSICYPNKYTCNNGGCIDLRLVFLFFYIWNHIVSVTMTVPSIPLANAAIRKLIAQINLMNLDVNILDLGITMQKNRSQGKCKAMLL